MLLNFKVSNFRSFYKPVSFSMYADSVSEYKDTNTFTVSNKLTGKNKDALLKFSALFGANASGKSNLIKALSFMANAINKSTVNDIYRQDSSFVFYDNAKNEPTIFDIEIVSNNVFYQYGFEIQGQNMTKEYLKKRVDTKITKVFSREDNDVTIGANKLELDVRVLLLSYAHAPMQLDIAKDLKNVYEWFAPQNLVFINDSMANYFDIYQHDNAKYGKLAQEFLREADFCIDDFEVVKTNVVVDVGNPFLKMMPMPPQVKRDPAGSYVELDIKTKHNIYNDKDEAIGALEIYMLGNRGFHSDGTIRLMQILGTILHALDKGQVIVVDEIDSKLHFLIVEYIIKKFNSIDSNKNNAQLVITAHNVLIMNGALRRDQICVVEKDTIGQSDICRLSDYNDVRREDLFCKKYLAGFYGGVPKLDRGCQ